MFHYLYHQHYWKQLINHRRFHSIDWLWHCCSIYSCCFCFSSFNFPKIFFLLAKHYRPKMRNDPFKLNDKSQSFLFFCLHGRRSKREGKRAAIVLSDGYFSLSFWRYLKYFYLQQFWTSLSLIKNDPRIGGGGWGNIVQWSTFLHWQQQFRVRILACEDFFPWKADLAEIKRQDIA